MAKNVTSSKKTRPLCEKDFSPTSNRQKYCKAEACRKVVQVKKDRRRYLNNKEWYDKYRAEKLGQKVGVGSGGNQEKGKNHHSYKTGIGLFRDLAKANKDPICERCKIDLDYSKPFTYCVHHRDHDRTNNELENLEMLCKRCHQLEHDCFGLRRKRKAKEKANSK